ncbi:zinc/iron-chelating domain protein [Carex rostrata]
MAMTVCLGRVLTTPPLAAAVRCAAGKRTASTSSSTKNRRNTADTVDKKKRESKRTEPTWQCASGCGACCKLAKGPAFPSPEDIFSDDPGNLQLYKSLIGPDGWCIHYESDTRRCSIYNERPVFCRVEQEVFEKLYGIKSWRFNQEACTACIDTIKAVYGTGTQELKNFKQLTRGR